MQNLQVTKNLFKMSLCWTSIHFKNYNITRMREIVQTNCQLTIRQMANDLHLTFYTVQSILTKDLQMHHKSAKFILKILTNNALKCATICWSIVKMILISWTQSSWVMRHGSCSITLKWRPSLHSGRINIPHHQKKHNHVLQKLRQCWSFSLIPRASITMN